MNFMKTGQSIKMAMKSIMGNKARSALTMLGIVIGVGSVILLTGIGGGATKEITDSLAEMGTKLITVNMNRRQTSRTVGIDDFEKFIEQNPDLLSDMSPYISNRAQIKLGNNNFQTVLDAVDSSYSHIRGNSAKLLSGRFISDTDIENRLYVAVVGTYIRDELFGGADPVGETVKLNGKVFTIVGLYEENDDSSEGSGDDKVTIPYTTAVRFLKSKTISTYYFEAASEDTVEAAADALKSYIAQKLGSSNGFNVSSVKEMLETMDEMVATLTTMLAGIAGISLIVGGIGIMNIMTVSVSERTREIGIRKAIGARTTDILMQFLIESIFLSAMGGVVGIAVGLGLGDVVSLALDMDFVVQVNMVFISFGFSLLVGVFFGLAPALKAAKLNPIDALHSE
ncbi:MAG: ABC transporter permease [Oscillospiraceae bacterium]|nr:ABC transporter permease [Oscillospiraceae bacterium]